ncbi:MAG: DegV family protein [Chloroflexota bacterium]
MARVRVVTDSTAHLDPEIVEKFQLTVLPLEVHMGNEVLEDGPDFDAEVFFRQMTRLPTPPRVVAPPLEVFQQTYERLSQSTDQILSLHVSGHLTDVCEVARRAANNLMGRCDIVVLDSETLSVGLGILVEVAARAAAAGETLDEVVRLVRGMVQRIYVVFFVETLDYLEREGRIRPAQALLGAMLNIKPFLTMEDGELIPMEKVRSRDKAVDKLFEFVAEFSDIERIAVLQSSPLPTEETKLLLERLDMAFPGLDVPIVVYGPLLASHIGVGALGVIVFEGEEGAL